MRWKQADCKMFTTDDNQPDLTKGAGSILNNIRCIVIPVSIFLAKSGSAQVIFRHPWETYARKCECMLHEGSCRIIIPNIDGSEQAMFVATYRLD